MLKSPEPLHKLEIPSGNSDFYHDTKIVRIVCHSQCLSQEIDSLSYHWQKKAEVAFHFSLYKDFLRMCRELCWA